jgi:phosphopantetheinyl transferase
MRELIKNAKLSDRDSERWSRYRPLEKKRQFLSSRLAVRGILNREFGALADKISLDAMASGKPILKDLEGNSIGSISLSHTCNMTAIALCNSDLGLGVDVEYLQPLNTRTLGPSFISQDERQWIVDEGFHEHSTSMLAIWTLKEAFWKALGGPQFTDFRDITVDYRSGNLNASLVTRKGKRVPTAVHCFGNLQSLPCEIGNYSDLGNTGSQDTTFLGFLVTAGKEVHSTDAGWV